MIVSSQLIGMASRLLAAIVHAESGQFHDFDISACEWEDSENLKIANLALRLFQASEKNMKMQESAAAIFARALPGPRAARVWLKIALNYFDAENFESASAIAEKCLANTPDALTEFNAEMICGSAAFEIGNFQVALDAFSAAAAIPVEEWTRAPQEIFQRGQALVNFGNFSEAVKFFKCAMNMLENMNMAKIALLPHLARAQLRCGDGGARETATIFLALAPNCPEAFSIFYSSGENLTIQDVEILVEKSTEAEHITNCIEKIPGQLLLHFLETAKKRFAGARAIYDEICVACCDRVFQEPGMCMEFFDVWEPPATRELCARAFKSGWEAATNFFHSGNFTMAAEILEKIQTFNESPELFMFMAVANLHANRLPAARDAAERALRADSINIEAQCILAEICLLEKKFEAAVAEIEKIKNPPILFLLHATQKMHAMSILNLLPRASGVDAASLQAALSLLWETESAPETVFWCFEQLVQIPGVGEWARDFAWNFGVRCGRAENWVHAAGFFEYAHSFAADDEEEAKMTALLVSGAFSRIAENHEKTDAARARVAHEHSLIWARKGSATSRGAADPMLILLEFRALVALDESKSLSFVQKTIYSNTMTIKSLEVMAAIAVSRNAKTAALMILQRLVAVALESPPEQRSLVPVYLRETILLASLNEAFDYFERAVAVASSGEVFFSPDELHWLTAFSWNAGVDNHRKGDFVWAEKWLAKSIGLLTNCPPLKSREKEMRAVYEQILHER